MDSGGEVYNPNGTPVSNGSGGGSGSGSSASGSSGGSSGTFTAQDLADAITAGDAGKIIELVSQSGGTASPETQTVTMSAEDLGLPTGGTVTLTVTGRGVSFSETRGADADGFVRFEVPKVETNSWLTVELSVQDSNGTIFWYGRDTQQVKDGGNLSVSIVRQFWTLPAGLTVAASPSAIAYNDTAPDSTSVTFSITNLAGAPDDAAFTYSWKDETGAEVGTGASLTRTAGQMLGASFTPLNDSETRTYSVDVSYTDASGSTVTSSGSATATIATAATLIVNATGLQTEGDRYVLAVNKGTAVSFTADVLCYGGTVDYSWSPSSPAFGSVTGTGTHNENAGISPSAGGKYTLTVTADLGGGRTPLTKDIDVYVLDLTLSKGGSLLGASDPVFITDATGDIPSATLTAALDGLAGLSGVSYSWQVGSTSVATVSPAGSTPSATATVSSAAAGTTMVQVTASYKGVTTVPVSRPLCVVGLAVKKSGTVLTGDLVMAKDAAAPTGLTAEVSGYGAGVNYSWSPSGTALGSVSGTGTHNENASLTPAAGGKSTLTVTATITANGMTLSKTIDVYVFDLNLSGPGLTVPATPGANYSLVTSTNDTSGVAVNASLAGTGMPSVSYTWTPGSGADSYIELTGSANAVRTVKPKAAGTTSFTVGVSYGGATVASRTVDVSVAGIVFTTFPRSVAMGGATSSCTLEAEVQGYSGTVSWGVWGSETTTVATVSGQTDSSSNSSVTLNALAGGKTKISVTATVGGVTLSAEKEIYILQLNLSCGDSSFTPPSGIADPNYKLMLIKGNPLTTDITANLAGLPEGSVSYTWTPLTSTKLDMTASGTGNKTVRLVPSATGNETVSVQATYDGESITKSVDVSVVGITLTGSSTLVFNSDPTANQITLTATLENIGLADLTNSGIQFTSNATSIATVTAGTATSTGRPATVTALKGGTVTVTVTAAIRASGKVFSAKKDITIIRLLVKDGAGHDVPATGNSLTDGPVTLTAELEGIATGVTYTWTCTPASGAAISISSTSGTSTTVSGTSGSADVKVTATYGGTNYTKTMAFAMEYVFDVATLSNQLTTITGTSADNPAKITITGLTATNWTDIKAALTANPSVYVDLSGTTLPDGITSMSYGFAGCSKLVKAPVLPASMAGSMSSCFSGCTSLTEAPAIPAGVTSLASCFFNCRVLTDVSALNIPNTVTDMSGCFQDCMKLADTSGLVIPNSVTNMSSCFSGCDKLTAVPTIPSYVINLRRCFYSCVSLTDVSGLTIPGSVTSLEECFYDCNKLTNAPEIPASVLTIYKCFYDCSKLAGTIVIKADITDDSNCWSAFKGVGTTQSVTVKVRSTDVENAIKADSNNSNVAIDVDPTLAD